MRVRGKLRDCSSSTSLLFVCVLCDCAAYQYHNLIFKWTVMFLFFFLYLTLFFLNKWAWQVSSPSYVFSSRGFLFRRVGRSEIQIQPAIFWQVSGPIRRAMTHFDTPNQNPIQDQLFFIISPF